MSTEITKQLQQTFDQARRAHEARYLTKGSDWAILQDLEKREDQALKKNQSRYEAEYPTRVEQEKRRLIKEAGKVRKEHPAPYGQDRFDSNAINHQSRRNVKNSHFSQQSKTKEGFAGELEDTLVKARNRPNHQGRAKAAFSKTVDRRSGIDRRLRQRSR